MGKSHSQKMALAGRERRLAVGRLVRHAVDPYSWLLGDTRLAWQQLWQANQRVATVRRAIERHRRWECANSERPLASRK